MSTSDLVQTAIGCSMSMTLNRHLTNGGCTEVFLDSFLLVPMAYFCLIVFMQFLVA
jgi:hypothetical protein